MICSRAFCSESRHALRSCSVVLPPIKLTIARAAARQVSSMSICGMSARVLSVEPHIMATTAAAITTALWFRGGSLQNHRSTGPRRSINFPSQTTRLGSSATDNRTADLIRQSLFKLDRGGRHTTVHVRFAPKADKLHTVLACPLCANSDRMQRGETQGLCVQLRHALLSENDFQCRGARSSSRKRTANNRGRIGNHLGWSWANVRVVGYQHFVPS